MFLVKCILGYIISFISLSFLIEFLFPFSPSRPIDLVPIFAAMFLIPAIIANKKGHSFFLWLIYSNLIWIVALVHAIVLKENDNIKVNDNKLKKCPYCGEFVRKEAIKCRYCQSELSVSEPIINNVATEGAKVLAPMNLKPFEDYSNKSKK